MNEIGNGRAFVNYSEEQFARLWLNDHASSLGMPIFELKLPGQGLETPATEHMSPTPERSSWDLRSQPAFRVLGSGTNRPRQLSPPQRLWSSRIIRPLQHMLVFTVVSRTRTGIAVALNASHEICSRQRLSLRFELRPAKKTRRRLRESTGTRSCIAIS